MNKCLVTKLKAEVNNPNLPVFTPIHQITLDAIAASGNLSMSDKQIKVLDDFFISIGANDNSGIYTKMDVIFLPCICNQNVQKTLVNYKDLFATPTYADNIWQYQGSGVIKHSSVTSNVSRIRIQNISDFDSVNRSISIGYYRPNTPLANLSTYFVGYESSNQEAIINANILFLNTKSEDAVAYNGYRFRMNEQNAQFRGAIINVASGVASGVLIKDTENVTTPLIEEIGTPVTYNGVAVTRQYFNEWPFGIMLYGKPLTAAEQIVVANSIRDILNAFEIN